MIQQGLISLAGQGRVRFKLPLFQQYLADNKILIQFASILLMY